MIKHSFICSIQDGDMAVRELDNRVYKLQSYMLADCKAEKKVLVTVGLHSAFLSDDPSSEEEVPVVPRL